MKGLKRKLLKTEISVEDYEKTLLSEEEQMREMKLIRSDKHEIYSVKLYKVALSANDDKRIVGKDKVKTFALR